MVQLSQNFLLSALALREFAFKYLELTGVPFTSLLYLAHMLLLQLSRILVEFSDHICFFTF